MRNKKRGLVALTYTLLVLLISTGSVQSSQLYINELLEANPPPQVLKEGPVVRVIQPGVQKSTPDEEHIEEEVEVESEPKPLRKVALTFDDGPDAHYTSRILDILKTEDVLATFFVLGEYVERYPELVKRIFGEGHLIANHSRTHGDLALLTNDEIIALELDPTSQLIENLTGYYPMMMRPPYGSLRPDSVNFLKETGWRIVRWSLDTFDWDSRRNKPEQIINRIKAQHHNGAVVLMHCNGPATTTVLPDVIRTFRDLGYEFVTVMQL